VKLIAQPRPAQAANELIIRVQPGDTLSKIALRYYGSTGPVHVLAEANGISNPDTIFVGQTLRLPNLAAAPSPASTPGLVVVQPGDTLAGISQRYYGSAAYIDAIAAANGLRDRDWIRAGMTLKLPEAGGTVKATAVQTAAVVGAPTAGVATYYGIEDGFVGGTMYCGKKFSPTDPTVVAVSPGRYPCGTRLLVTERRSGRSIEVTVQDHCGGCGWNHLDLSRAAFSRLAPVQQGRIDVSWVVLPK
jgi:LysM repeat protein